MSNTRSKGELGFQRHIIDALCSDPHWQERNAQRNYDREHAVDRGMLAEFLGATQPNAYDALVRGYGDRALDVVIAEYEKACRAKGSSQIDVLRGGVDINSTHVTLLYNKPASDPMPTSWPSTRPTGSP